MKSPQSISRLLACLVIISPFAANGAVVINELDYDNIGTDTAEFLELYNDGATSIDISGYLVGFINGNGNVFYNQVVTIPAATTLAPGAYYVIGSTNVVGANFTFALTDNQIQNGSPDAVAVYSGGTFAVGDASTTNAGNLVYGLLYEGPADAVNYPGFLAPGIAVSDSNTQNYSIGLDSVGNYNVLSSPTPGAVNAVAVPEPSTLLLGVLATLGLIRRRR